MGYQSNLFRSCAIVGVASLVWLFVVASSVSEPYLDEFFHVRQADQYWVGNWDVWDPKITTPPGLYAVSYAWLWLQSSVIYLFTGTFNEPYRIPLIFLLRSINWVGINGIFTTANSLLVGIVDDELTTSNSGNENRTDEEALEVSSSRLVDVARNVALFPPLFFFSGLYYTDILSILVVLLCYDRFHEQDSVGVIFLGVASLLFRQNNIFWCAIYLAGLEVLRTLQRNPARQKLHAYSQISLILSESWTKGAYFDPLVDDAGIEDYILCGLSIGIATLANLRILIINTMPYIILLILFGSFVFWNGSVVLGDKSNHVASLHLPQMLYIWPYFTLFSFFAILPPVMFRCQNVLQSQSPVRELSKLLPRPLVLFAALGAGTAAVRFNTIIHPFTLADNRHYTFYVFRILRLYPALKYVAVPVYIICAWAALTALGTPRGAAVAPSKSKASKAESKTAVAYSSGSNSGDGNRASFVLVWLISSALGLVTAPLVEPRYFILPWIMWRLHVPIVRPKIKDSEKTATEIFADWAPWLETGWSLLINAVTMYIFVMWEFEWRQEPGVVQRFMW